MRKLYRIVVAGFLAMVLLFVSDLPVQAASVDRHIYDHADLLTTEEEMELEDLAREVFLQLDVYIAIITKDDGMDVADYSHDFYQQLAAEGIKDTLIVTVDMQAREFYFIAYDLADVLLTDYELDKLYDTFRASLSSEDFFAGFQTFITDARYFIANESTRYEEGSPSTGNVPEDHIFYRWWVQLIGAALIAAGVVGYMAYISGGKVTITEGTYRDHTASKIRARRDRYLRTVVTKTKRSKSNPNGGGGFRGGSSSSSRRGSF